MHIQLGNHQYPFQPWRPDVGRLNTNLLALDTETTLIDEDHHWLTPTYVLGAVFDGKQGYFLTREYIEAFLALHQDVQLVMHNAAFDLDVLQQVAAGLDVYEWVERDLVWDTYLLHRLLRLATTGDTARGKGESTLERCAIDYLGIELPKDTVDSCGKPVRLSYDRWLHRPPQEIEPVYRHITSSSRAPSCCDRSRLRDYISTWTSEMSWLRL